MAKHHDIAIIGGGMVGMTLAIALARENLSVAVIEKGALSSQLEPAFDGRVSAVALGSKHLLDNIGVWQGMANEAQPILDIRVSDGDTPFFLHYDHHEVGSEPFGYIVENRHTRHALHSAAKTYPSVALYERALVQGFETDDTGVTVRLDSGDLRCRLLIGADGKQSPVRKIAGIAGLEWNYNQTAIVCTIGHEHPHGGLAQERFLPAGPFAVLPLNSLPHRGRVRVGADLRDGKDFVEQDCPPPSLPPSGEGIHRSSLVWVEPDDRVQLYLDLPEEECAQEIAERVGGYLGKITLEGKRFSYPLSLMHAKTYVGKRLALAGDAAHAIHPIAGQGVNLGFRDVAVLAQLLGEAQRGGKDIGDEEVLAHYQRWRRFDNTAMLAVTDGLNRLFSNSVIPIGMARDAGMWAVGKMPGLKRFFMRHAMGLTGDVPDLMKRPA